MIQTTLRPSAPLVEAVRAIEESRRRIAIVTDPERRVLGTLTDGDVRRCLLAGGSLQTPVEDAMNRTPITAEVGSPDAYLLDLMRRGNILAVPLVDPSGRFERLVHLTDLAPDLESPGDAAAFAFAVIMAGGEGKRLRPLTDTVPKPMLDIAGVPLLERQVRRLARAGISRIYLSVNYLNHVIEQHFGDGRELNVDIRYLRESEKLGTAGALALLPERPQQPILVMNGDILTTFHFGSLLVYHREHGAEVTVAAIDYRIHIPYGVLSTDGAYLTSLQEKPAQRFLCNAGVYALAPQTLGLVSDAGRCDMTDLLDACLGQGYRVAVFPVHEYWSDVGTADELEKARAFFSNRAATE